MDQLAQIQLDETTLKEITRLEVSRYVATSLTDIFYPVLDDTNKTYAVIIVPGNAENRPSWAFVLARVVDDYIVIEEDGPPDKPLAEALMVNGGVPREKIILAYKGEMMPAIPK
jgi:hypothetical protein